MLIAFQDFIPQVQRKRLLAMINEYEDLHEVVTRANRWIEEERVRVLNVETLLVTRLPSQEGENIPVSMDSPANVASMCQIVRVWYAQEPEPPAAQTGATTRLG